VSLKPIEQKGVELIWKAWRIPVNSQPSPKPEGYGEQAKEHLQTLLKDVGLHISPPSEKSDTFLAHIGAKYAKEQRQFNLYHQRIFEAVWKDSQNIGDKKVLIDIAKGMGFNPIEFEEALSNPSFIDQVESDFKSASEKQVWTIPSYLGAKGMIQVHHFKDLPTLEELENIIT
jgi:predicted DsbA family dithiol-disulfide isomerase